MKTTFDDSSKILTVQVPGDLISTSADGLRSSLGSLLAPTPTRTVPWEKLRLDLSAASMVDSVGLNLVVTILRAVQKLNARLQISYTSPNVLRTFKFTRLDQHVDLVKVA